MSQMTSHVVPAGRVKLMGRTRWSCRIDGSYVVDGVKNESVKYSKIVHKALRGLFYLKEKCCGVSTLEKNALD